MRRVLLGIALLAYLAFLVRHDAFVVGGPDSSGYFNFARMLTAGRLSLEAEPLIEMNLDRSWLPVFAPSGFRPAQQGRAIVPTYPVGLPLHLALLGHWTTPVAATVCLLLMILIARELGLPEWAALAGAAMLGAFPAFLLTATQPLSDVVATMWALAAVYLSSRAFARDPGGRGAQSMATGPDPSQTLGMTVAAAAGVAFALGVLVRPTNLLLAPALIVAMREKPRQLLIAAAAALPFGIGLLVLQNALYGSPWRTGYDGGMLALAHVAAASAHGIWLAKLATPLVFPLGLVTRRWVLVAWFVPFFAFYALYGVYGSWTDTRFLLPALPALILGALAWVRRLPVIVAAVLIAAMVIVPIKQARVLHVLDVTRREAIYRDSVTWAEREIPDDAMVMAGLFTGTFLFYERRWTVNWPMLEGDRFQLLRAYAAPRPWYALLSDVELPPEELRRRYAGRWVVVGRREDVTLWRLAD